MAGEFQSTVGGFIGRAAELAELRAALDDATAGHGRMFLVSGEPGIGKTRLTNEVASRAANLGARVICGRCWQGPGAPAYWPWIQIVRTCIGTDGVNALMGSERSEVSALLPELAPRRRSISAAPQLRTLPSTDTEEARFRLFDSTARLLIEQAAKQPLMLIVDDLHDADQPSLLMLRFVARELGSAHILAIGTYRDTEVRRSPALSKLIGDIGRESKPLPLAGFRRDEVWEFVERHSNISPDVTLVTTLHRATAGNPLFLDGIVRLMRAQGEHLVSERSSSSGMQLPEGVREAIRVRLSALSEQCNRLLAIAAVIGLEFDADFLQRVSGSGLDAVIDTLDEAQREGIIVALNGVPGRPRFSHGLIGETIYDNIPTAARIRMHQRIARKMEASYAANLDSHLAELAHHYRQAAQLGEAAKAIDYSIRAGEAAFAVHARRKPPRSGRRRWHCWSVRTAPRSGGHISVFS